MDRQRLIEQAVKHVLREYGSRGYESWREEIGEAILIPHPNDGTVEIEISPRWDHSPGGPIRVIVSVLHTTRFGISVPGTDFLVYSDGHIDAP